MHKCPTCDRAFNSFSDYPLVYVAKVERIPLTLQEQSIIINDSTIYVGPKSECGNPRPPQEVLEFFKNHPDNQTFEFNKSKWTFEGPPNRYIEPKSSLIRKVFRMPPEIIESWQVGRYSRTQKGSFATETIAKYADAYLNHLESLVGKEVPSLEVLPRFEDERYKGHKSSNIPGSQYNVFLEALDAEFVIPMLKQNSLPIPALETEKPSRKVAICLTTSGGGSISVIEFLATLGGFAYEGRLKTQ